MKRAIFAYFSSSRERIAGLFNCSDVDFTKLQYK
jgi:hypothetical protein